MHYRRLITVLFLFGLLCIIPADFSLQKNLAVAAIDPTSILEQNIDQVNARIQLIEAEIATYRSKASQVSEAKRTLESELRQLELEHQKIAKDIELNRSKIDLTALEISEITRDILRIETSVRLNQDALESSLRAMYEIDNQSFLEKLLSQERIADFWRETDELQAYQQDIDDHVSSLEDLKNKLSSQRSESQKHRDELALLQGQIVDRVELAEKQKDEQAKLVTATRNEEAKFQQLINEREALKKAFEDELYAYESQLQVILDPTSLPRPGSEPLRWPLDNIYVTQRFGQTVDSSRLYTSGSHSGVDFRANGDPVYAMADGIISGTGNTDIACNRASFGKWIFVQFDNNLAATYGHLSLIKVQTGQRVQAGQLIGYSGNTGRSTAPHLHVTVYAGVDANGASPVKVEGKESVSCAGATLVQPRAAREAYLNPLDYLPSTSSDMFKHPKV